MPIKPYERLADLPAAVRELSEHLQEIWMATFNSVWSAHAELDRAEREALSASAAWSAVNRERNRSALSRAFAARIKSRIVVAYRSRR